MPPVAVAPDTHVDGSAGVDVRLLGDQEVVGSARNAVVSAWTGTVELLMRGAELQSCAKSRWG